MKIIRSKIMPVAPKSCLAVFALLLMSGCASIVDGSSQTLSVKTTKDVTDIAGASCSLQNDKGTWFTSTPGTVTIHRSIEALNVKCTKDGFAPTVQSVNSSTKGMAFGNILFGGLIGVGVDISTGAAYDYPALMTIPMQPAVMASVAAPTS
jgi:uncharacterized protein YceK